MQERANTSKWLGKTGKVWAVLAQGAAWIVAIVGGFLFPPPVVTSEKDERIWIGLASFIITVLVGLMFIAGQRWKRKKYLARWGATSAVLLVLAIASFLAYQLLYSSRTCKYYDKLVVIGTEYTQEAVRFMEKQPDHSCEYLVKSVAGKVDDIWTKQSIDRSRMQLAIAYISCIPLFTLCIIAVVQSIYIHEVEKNRSQTTRKK
jgi:hypothetical protein